MRWPTQNRMLFGMRSNSSTFDQAVSRACWLGFALCVLAGAHLRAGDIEHQANWGQWRGPAGTGTATNADPPIRWSETENIQWKRELPGLGHSTPVVWGDRLFVTAAEPYGDQFEPLPDRAPGAHDNLLVSQRQRFLVLALDRASGETLWQRVVYEGIPHEGGHRTGSLASHSPVTDGEHVFAFFGSRGLYCYSIEGEQVWHADFGNMRSLHGHGEASSPALYDDTLIVNWDHEGQSAVFAFDKRTGQQRWRASRDEVTSWCSPIIVEHDGRVQVIVAGTGKIRSYDLATGQVIWECGGLSRNVVATPVVSDGIVFAGSSYDTRALLAIRLGGSGDLTDSEHVLWRTTRGTPYVPSPLLVDGALYFLAHYQNVLSRVEAATGKKRISVRLDPIGNIYSSPVAVPGRLYITDLSGTTMVLSSSSTPALLAVNKLEDRFSASAAIVGNQLFLRGARTLYCLSTQ